MFKNFCTKANGVIEQYIILMTPLSALLGFVLRGKMGFMSVLSNPLFMLISFTGALNIHLKDMKDSFSFKTIILVLLTRHVIMPFLAVLSIKLLHPADEMFVGLMLMFAGPCAATSFVWASIFGGKKSLSVLLTVLDSAASFIITPLLVRITCGSAVTLDLTGMIINLLTVVVIPSAIGVFVASKVEEKKIESLTPYIKFLTKITIILLISYSISIIADSIRRDFNTTYLCGVLVDSALVALSYYLGYLVGKYILKLDMHSTVSVAFSVGMRNLGLSVILAQSFFPPMVALPPVLGLCYQELITSTAGKLLHKKVLKEDSTL